MMERKYDFYKTLWVGTAVAVSGMSAYFGNLLLKFPDFNTRGEKIAFLGSTLLILLLLVVFLGITLKLRRLVE
ncbi:hypothetical protein HG1285_03668 [Hydrogenivirga sp. 128-5-R1-1]|nr:hypothetical protein HG1285_03668 [Hydrogenivirga sp. 128-5-R1-1]